MKVSIVAPIGTSPPVITEFLQYVEEALSQKVSDLTIIATSEESVKNGVELVKEAVSDRYPHVHVHTVYLPFSDIDTQERNYEFIKIASRILRDQKEKHKVDRLYVCIAGGRKDMCVALATLAQFFDVNAIFHIIVPNIKAFNEELERIRYEIDELARSSDKRSYYLQNKSKFDPIMYPPLNSYSVIQIPILPFPKDILWEIIKLLSKPGKTHLKEVKLPQSYLKSLEDFGFIKMTENYVYTGQLGMDIANLLMSSV